MRRSPAGDRRIFQRLSALLWIDEGRAREEVAELLGVSSRQVGDWLRIFRDKGLDELCTLHYRGDPGRLRPAQVERLQQEIATGAFHNAEQVRAWIEEQFGVTYSASGVKDLLHRIGASYHKVSQQAGGPGVACPPSAVSPGVPAGVLAPPEPDRAPVEVREVRSACRVGTTRTSPSSRRRSVECLEGVEGKHKLSIESLLTLNFQTFEKPQLLAA